MKSGESSISSFELLFHALVFSADKHKHQRRKGQEQYPYINHPIRVAHYLAMCCKDIDKGVLIAAVLHDTIEDTNTTPEEIQKQFGDDVLCMVKEVTDDKKLPKKLIKRLQVISASKKSCGARLIRIADKIDNVEEMIHSPPIGWSIEQKREYLEWTERVVDRLRGTNKCLERLYREKLDLAKKKLELPSEDSEQR